MRALWKKMSFYIFLGHKYCINHHQKSTERAETLTDFSGVVIILTPVCEAFERLVVLLDYQIIEKKGLERETDFPKINTPTSENRVSIFLKNVFQF